MSKLRVLDLANEFGISSDEVTALLRSMDVSVRTHMSVLSDDQIARVRARWEREKRARAEKPATEAAGTRRRRAAAAPADATDAAPAPARKKVAKVEPPPPPPEPVEAKPAVRRRKRVDVEAEQAAADAAAAAAAAAEAEAAELANAEVRRAEEAAARAAAAEAAAAEAAAAEAAAAAKAAAEQADTESAEVESAAPPEPAPAAPPTPRPVGASGLSLPERPRPRPVVPGAPRPKPVTPGMPRPIASATPGGPGAPAGGRDMRDSRGGTGGGGQRQQGGGGGGGGGTAAPDRGRRGGRKGKRGADQEAVAANLTKTMRELRGAPARRGPRRVDGVAARELLEQARLDAAEKERKTVRVNEFITVSELASMLGVPATEIVSFAFKTLGMMVTINQRLDFDQIELIALEFGFQAVREEEYAASTAETETPDAPESLASRPPVVTIMGHVDHGKTSLLDFIRRTNVVAGESGGITQHIGAYHVALPSGKQITFLDTPGHEAFTAMRARGAQVTDIVVLVVAADDSVMPQTIEAISHAKNAGVPMIVAINKIDLPAANPEKVKQGLLQHGVVLEAFGGQTLSSELSAKTGKGVDALLDQLLLQAEILDLKANPSRTASGTVIEAQLDPGKGPVATVLVQNGTLRVGDSFICGMHSGRVRALLDERGKPVKDAGPAIPVQVLGLQGIPQAGDQLQVVTDANEAREIAQRRERLDREAKSRRTSKGGMSLETFMAQAAQGERRSLKILIKADQGGPAEALADSLQQLTNPEVNVEVVHRAVGAVTESDIQLAKAAGAIILGFHVRPDSKARTAAEREGVDIRLYKIIYEAVNDVKAAIEGMLRPEQKEVIVGEAEVRETFKVSKLGTIAGCIVRSGLIVRTGRARVIRSGVEVYAGTLASLRRFKDDVKEVKEGFECGIAIENFNDIKVGDMIECYRTDTVARTLADTPASA